MERKEEEERCGMEEERKIVGRRREFTVPGKSAGRMEGGKDEGSDEGRAGKVGG